MKKNLTVTAIAGALALASCSTAPQPVQVAMPVAKPVAAPLPYRWTHGHSDSGREAMRASFGRLSLNPGEYLWLSDIPATGDTRLVIDLLTQTAFVYRADQLIGAASISSGKKGKETPLGFWSVLEKKKLHLSRKYDNAPMPFMQRIDDHGIALHAGKTPGYPASRGCVRFPAKFAERLYTLTKIGSKVVIEG